MTVAARFSSSKVSLTLVIIRLMMVADYFVFDSASE